MAPQPNATAAKLTNCHQNLLPEVAMNVKALFLKWDIKRPSSIQAGGGMGRGRLRGGPGAQGSGDTVRMATVSRALRHNLFLWGCHSILLGSLALLFHLSSAKPPPTPLSPCAFHLSWPPKSFPRYPPDAAAPGRTEQQPGKRPEPQKATRKMQKCARENA